MAIDSYWGCERKMNWYGPSLSLLQALGDHTKGEGFSLDRGFFGIFAISENSRQFGNLCKPAPVLFLVVLDAEVHGYSD